MLTRSLTSANTTSPVTSCPEFGWLRAALHMAATVSGAWPLTSEPGRSGWASCPRVATRTPVADARAVREARRFAVATMRRWGAAQRCGDVAVVVSELVTNALRYAAPRVNGTAQHRPFRLGLVQLGPCIVCVVTDPSPVPPVPQDPGRLTETGRGLHVIDALSDNWGYTTLCGQGKAVWATFASTAHTCPPAPGAAGTDQV